MHVISGGDSGGAKTHVFALLDELKKYIGVKVVCFVDGVFYREIKEKDIDLVFLKQKNRLDLSVVGGIKKIIEEEGFDILHVHGARANFVASFLKGRINIPIITTMHSDYRLDFDTPYKKLVFTNLNRIAFRLMDYYVAVSNDFKNRLIHRGFRPNTIYTIYNGIDFEQEPQFQSKEEFAKRFNIPQDGKTNIGIIGRFDKVKSHDVFIKAALLVLKENKNARFLFAGEGPLENTLKAMTKGYEEHFVFCGFVKDIYSFINFIDINVLTSKSESFPYVLLEGAKMKKATVSSNVGGISDLVIDKVTGRLFERGNYHKLSQILLELINNKEERERYGENIYKHAKENFSSVALARTQLAIYESVLRDYYDKKKYDFVLSGYYGFKNSGDDAILESIINSIRKEYKDARFMVLSRDKRETKALFGVDSVNRFNPISIHRAFKRGKVLLSGGGSLIQDQTSTQSLIYYISLINYAKKLGLKTMVYANGIGPIIRERNLKPSREALENVDCITLRDPMSALELERIGVKSPKPIITADPVLLLEPLSKIDEEKLFERLSLDSGREYLMIATRRFGKFNIDKEIAKVADYYNKKGLPVIFVPMQIPKDLKMARAVAKNMETELKIIDQRLSAREIITLTKKCKLVLAMRLHSLIYSASAGVPMVAIDYDPKIKSFMEYLGITHTIPLNEVDSGKIIGTIDLVLDDVKKQKEFIEKRKEELASLAYENAKIAVGLLEND